MKPDLGQKKRVLKSAFVWTVKTLQGKRAQKRAAPLGEQTRKRLYPKQTEGGETTKSGMWRINRISAPIQVSSAGDKPAEGDTADLCSGSSSDRTVPFWANQPLWTLVPSSIKWISSPTLLICENDKLITVNSHFHSALLNSYCNPQHWARQLQDRVTVLGPPNHPVQNTTTEKCPV